MSLLDRMDQVKQLCEKKAEERNLSPSQRDRFVSEQVRLYQRPEIIR